MMIMMMIKMMAMMMVMVMMIIIMLMVIRNLESGEGERSLLEAIFGQCRGAASQFDNLTI